MEQTEQLREVLNILQFMNNIWFGFVVGLCAVIGLIGIGVWWRGD